MPKNILKSQVNEVVYCKSILSKAIGLMFSKPKDRAMVFFFGKENTISIHMFFVFYKIDIFWLDKDKRITDLQKGCVPFTLIKARPAQYVIEAKAGLLRFKKGDIIDF